MIHVWSLAFRVGFRSSDTIVRSMTIDERIFQSISKFYRSVIELGLFSLRGPETSEGVDIDRSAKSHLAHDCDARQACHDIHGFKHRA